MTTITEDTLKQTTLSWFQNLGCEITYGPDIWPAGDTLTPALSQWEREGYMDVVLVGRLRSARGTTRHGW